MVKVEKDGRIFLVPKAVAQAFNMKIVEEVEEEGEPQPPPECPKSPTGKHQFVAPVYGDGGQCVYCGMRRV